MLRPQHCLKILRHRLKGLDTFSDVLSFVLPGFSQNTVWRLKLHGGRFSVIALLRLSINNVREGFNKNCISLMFFLLKPFLSR